MNDKQWQMLRSSFLEHNPLISHVEHIPQENVLISKAFWGIESKDGWVGFEEYLDLFALLWPTISCDPFSDMFHSALVLLLKISICSSTNIWVGSDNLILHFVELCYK